MHAQLFSSASKKSMCKGMDWLCEGQTLLILTVWHTTGMHYGVPSSCGSVWVIRSSRCMPHALATAWIFDVIMR